MTQLERDLISYLALCVGALKVLTPKDNEPLKGVVSGAEDLIFAATESASAEREEKS